MANESLKFKKGLHTRIPSQKEAGSVLFETDTGNMFVDTSDSERVQVKDSTKLPLTGGTVSGDLNVTGKLRVAGQDKDIGQIAQEVADLSTTVDDHLNQSVSDVDGVHGIRYSDGKLQVNNDGTWEDASSGGGMPPLNVSGLSCSVGNQVLTISWSDPSDTTIEGQTLVTWKGTKLVMSETGLPTKPTDGTLLVDNTVRDQYKTNGYTITGLINDKTYYFALFPYSTDGVINMNDANKVSGTPRPYVVFGVSIDTTNSNPSTAVTYTDSAVGHTAGSPAWDTEAIFKDIKPCVFKDGVFQYYLNRSDFTKKEDGTASDITTLGNDVMVEIPKIGFKISRSDTTINVQITDNPNASGFSYKAHTRATEGDRDKVYIGSYLGFLSSNKLYSSSGRTPTASKSLTNFRTYAQARGTGYDLVGFYQLTLLQCLYLIKYKNLNSQSALGRGYVDSNSAATSTGGTNASGWCYGETTGKKQMKLFGIEDFWGNLFWWIDGIYSDSNRNILTATQNFNDTGSGYTNNGQGATSDVSGWLSDVQGTSDTGFVAKTASGSSTTYYCDGGYLSASCCAYFGGRWDNGDNAGAFQLYVNYAASYANTYLGARLMYL